MYVSDHFTYRASIELARAGIPFYALIMAAMRDADTMNSVLLRGAFPDVWDDLQARYLAPDGVLETDPPALRAKMLGDGDGEARP